MAAIYADPDIPASGPLADGRSLDECLRALEDCGRKRLAPLAQHMAEIDTLAKPAGRVVSVGWAPKWD